MVISNQIIQFCRISVNGNVISNVLGIECKDFEGFWPQRQPQWDGIAISKDKTLYLLRQNPICLKYQVEIILAPMNKILKR